MIDRPRPGVEHGRRGFVGKQLGQTEVDHYRVALILKIQGASIKAECTRRGYPAPRQSNIAYRRPCRSLVHL